ncbi:MAG: hypothetical protein AB4040_03110 [Synechococcus sp.]
MVGVGVERLTGRLGAVLVESVLAESASKSFLAPSADVLSDVLVPFGSDTGSGEACANPFWGKPVWETDAGGGKDDAGRYPVNPTPMPAIKPTANNADFFRCIKMLSPTTDPQLAPILASGAHKKREDLA